jgi:dephospho-CoA kinase
MIIGIAGSFGAGKGAVVSYLTAKKNFKHYSASGFITEEIERRGLTVNRDSMIVVANDLRSSFGASYIIDALYDRAKNSGADVIIESLRAVAEVRRIKELGGIVLGIDAEPIIRFKRSELRGSVKDGVTFTKWQSQEAIESNSKDPTKQNIFGALKEADYTITNNGTLEELHTKVENILKSIKNKNHA